MFRRNRVDAFERHDRGMRLFGTLFGIVWVLMFVAIVGSWALAAYLQYNCYQTQDPNSFACWYVSDRVEVGIRQR